MEDQTKENLTETQNDEEASSKAESRAKQDKNAEKVVSSYDPRKPSRLTRKQVKNLKGLFDKVVDDMAMELRNELRMDISFSVRDVYQDRYKSFTQTILPFSSVCQVTCDPLKDPFIWALDPSLVLALVDRFLGGSGDVDVEPRTLTTVEAGIAHRMIETIMDCVKGRWKPIVNMVPQELTVISNPSRLESIRGMDVVLVIVLRMMGREQELGEIMACIPFGALEDYLEPIGALDEILNIETAENTEWRSRLERKIQQVEIGLPVVLGEAEISVEDVLCLKQDDVIVIDRKISEPLEMPVGTGSVILGNIGVYNNRLALKITDIQKRENDAEEVSPSHG